MPNRTMTLKDRTMTMKELSAMCPRMLIHADPETNVPRFITPTPIGFPVEVMDWISKPDWNDCEIVFTQEGIYSLIAGTMLPDYINEEDHICECCRAELADQEQELEVRND